MTYEIKIGRHTATVTRKASWAGVWEYITESHAHIVEIGVVRIYREGKLIAQIDLDGLP